MAGRGEQARGQGKPREAGRVAARKEGHPAAGTGVLTCEDEPERGRPGVQMRWERCRSQGSREGGSQGTWWSEEGVRPSSNCGAAPVPPNPAPTAAS